MAACAFFGAVVAWDPGGHQGVSVSVEIQFKSLISLVSAAARAPKAATLPRRQQLNPGPSGEDIDEVGQPRDVGSLRSALVRAGVVIGALQLDKTTPDKLVGCSGAHAARTWRMTCSRPQLDAVSSRSTAMGPCRQA